MNNINILFFAFLLSGSCSFPAMANIKDFSFAPSFIMEMKERDAKTIAHINEFNQEILQLIQDIRQLRTFTDSNLGLRELGSKIENILSEISQVLGLKKNLYKRAVNSVREAENRKEAINKLNNTLEDQTVRLSKSSKIFMEQLGKIHDPHNKIYKDYITFNDKLQKTLQKYQED